MEARRLVARTAAKALPNLGPGGSDKYAGFPLNNMCAKPSPNHDNGYLYAPPLNLNTNTVTFTMWIKPNVATLPKSTGLFMNRNGYDAAGIGFGTTTNGSSTPCLAYTWNNNSAATYGWNSGLFPVAGVWNFVACTITPSNTVMYLYYVNGNTTNLYKAVNNVANVPEAFTGGTTWIASDNWNNGNTFNGWIDELAIFTNSLGEDQIQTMFLLSLGLTNGLPPVITQQPTNVAVFQGQTVQFSTLASGIPTPPTNGAGGSYQWQFYNGSTWNNLGSAVAPPRLTTNATMYWQVYTNPSTILSYRAIAKNASGSATSGVAYVTFAPIPTWNLGVWTVNFCVPSSGNLGLDTPYAGLGVLGTTNTMGTAIAGTTNTKAYWNVLSGGNMQNSTSLRDDGVTYSGVNVGATNGNLSSYSDGTNVNNLLLDQYCQIFDTNNGVNFFFTQVPKGIYNLALFGCTASYADRGIGFTAITNGVSAGTQWVTNNTWGAGDLFFTPYDNTVVFTNLVVTSGMLQVNAAIARAVPTYTNSTEADFNGAQLQLVTAGPDIWSLTNSGTNLILTYAGGILLSSTNIVGPTWVTNFGNPYTIIPTGQMRFFKVYTNKFPNP